MPMAKIKHRFGVVSWIHLTIITAIYTSPFWLNWQFILIGIIAYYLQLLIFGNCILTKKEFKEDYRVTSFQGFYLEKLLGRKINQKKCSVFLDRYMPWMILGTAIVSQIYFD